MNKNHLLIASAALVLASCASEEQLAVNEPRGIEFRTSLSRATETTDLNVFNVYAVWNNGLLIENDTYTVNPTPSYAHWIKQPLYYWPPTDTPVYFHAYAPTDIITPDFKADGEKKLNNFAPNSSIESQIDFISAYIEGKKSDYEGAQVPLVFKHRLSQIEIGAVRNVGAEDPYIYKIRGVRIGNVCGKADFDFAAVATDAEADINEEPGNGWVNVYEDTETPKYPKNPTIYTSSTFEAITLGTTSQILTGIDRSKTDKPKVNDGSAMLIPQQLVKWEPDCYDDQGNKNNKTIEAHNVDSG